MGCLVLTERSLQVTSEDLDAFLNKNAGKYKVSTRGRDHSSELSENVCQR